MVQNEARQATASQSLELVTLLLGMNVDVNAVDRRGRTAMHGAARLAKNAIIELLAAHGARVDIADARGQAPLDVGTPVPAAASGHRPPAAQPRRHQRQRRSPVGV